MEEPITQPLLPHICGGELGRFLPVLPQDSPILPVHHHAVALSQAVALQLLQKGALHTACRLRGQRPQGEAEQLALIRRCTGLAVQLGLEGGGNHDIAADADGERHNEQNHQDDLPGQLHAFTSSR